MNPDARESPFAAQARTGAPEVSAENSKAAAIRAHLEAGWTLIPLRGKIPIHRDWTKTPPGTFKEAELMSPGVNYGVVLGAGDLVLDIDPRNFRPGDRPLARLITALGAPLDSYTVRTGGGGLHVYFSKSADLLVCSALTDYPGIEIKSAGRQVVGPGSIHPDTGKRYCIVKGSPGAIAPAPAALLALVKITAVPFVEAGTGAYKNDAETQGRYADFLQKTAKPSIEGDGGDLNAFKIACRGRDLGLPPATTWELLLGHWNPRCLPPWDPEELKAKVIHAYKYAAGATGASHPAADFKPVEPKPPSKEEISWVLTPQGRMVKCFQNLLTYLRFPSAGLQGVFGYNEFTGQVEFTNPAPWHLGRMPFHRVVGDGDLKLLKGHLAVKHGFEMSVQALEEAVVITSYANRFHPVREYLKSLKWDGKPRLDTWLCDYASVEDTPYTRACARKVLCAAVMRVMRPGVKFDHVLVLEGDQGVGKSAICKILGGEWAGDFSLNTLDKDTVQLMQGHWIIEIAELEFTRRSDNDAIKAFITRETDKARLAYGRLAAFYPRQSVFIATKNPGPDGTYFKDDTGNRRWWPVHLDTKGERVDFKGLKAARNQLFAEAAARAAGKDGEKLYMETDSLKIAAEDAAELRHAEDPWQGCVEAWLQAQDWKNHHGFITGRDVFLGALGGFDKQFDRVSALRIAKVMRSLRWKRAVGRIEGLSVKGYRSEANAVEAGVLGDLV